MFYSSNHYELQPLGWTANENTENTIAQTAMGDLQNEIRYITHHQENEGFGVEDDRKATDMVGSISLTILR
ncbi:MAG: hypothetical protein PF447_04785 [Spirochaetaceae bacterium]|jgi:hypothetical protein|nr:hypothetical protein [Spirochaetaceae bacterium]